MMHIPAHKNTINPPGQIVNRPDEPIVKTVEPDFFDEANEFDEFDFEDELVIDVEALLFSNATMEES